MVNIWNTEICIVYLQKSTYKFSYSIKEFHMCSRKHNHPEFQNWNTKNSNFQIELTPMFSYVKYRDSYRKIYTKILIREV